MVHVRATNPRKKYKVDSKYALEIDFSDSVKHDIFTIIDRISVYINSFIPKEEKLTGVSVAGPAQFRNRSAEPEPSMKIVMNPEKYEGYKTLPFDLTWQQLENEVEGVTEFFNKYPLERSFTQARSQSVPMHRHKFNDQTKWSLTVMMQASNGTVRFYASDTDHLHEESSPPDESKCICVDEIGLEANKMYSLSTWDWHTWDSSKFDTNALITIFYFRGAGSYEEAKAIINNKDLTG